MPEKDWVNLPLQSVATLYALQELREDVEETSTNDSPAIREYLEAGGIHSPQPWCAAFCNWAAERAAMLKGTESPLEQVDYQAYVESYHRWAEANDLLVPAGEITVGDLFLLYDATRDDPVYGGTGRHVHIGFVRQPLPDSGKIKTVEGNTNEDGGVEGVEVGSLTREITDGFAFVRWAA